MKQLDGWWRVFTAIAVVWGLTSALLTLDRRSDQIASLTTLKAEWIEQTCGADHPSLARQAACKDAQAISVPDVRFPDSVWLAVFALGWISPLLLALAIVAIARWLARSLGRLRIVS
jgi:hypothetical protein